MINSVVLVGRMTRQPELRVTPKGTSVSNFTIAVQRDKETADFIDCVAFGKLADIVCEWGDKGRLVAVQGRLQTRSYETHDGQKRKMVEVLADSVQFLDRRKAIEVGEENAK